MEIKYLWVDEIVLDGIIGATNNIEKVYYNLELMGEYGKQLEQAINIKLLFVERDVEAIGSIGSFICVTNLKKNENIASMQLCNSRIGNKEFWQIISEKMYPDNTVQFMAVYQETILFSVLEGDSFELSTTAGD